MANNEHTYLQAGEKCVRLLAEIGLIMPVLVAAMSTGG
jgi:hypothetical protein